MTAFSRFLVLLTFGLTDPAPNPAMLIIVVGTVTIIVLIAVVVSCMGDDVSAHCEEVIIIVNHSIDPLRCVTNVGIKCSDEFFVEGWRSSEQ